MVFLSKYMGDGYPHKGSKSILAYLKIRKINTWIDWTWFEEPFWYMGNSLNMFENITRSCFSYNIFFYYLNLIVVKGQGRLFI